MCETALKKGGLLLGNKTLIENPHFAMKENFDFWQAKTNAK